MKTSVGIGISPIYIPNNEDEEPIVWLLNDNFTTPRAVGTVNGTAAEPSTDYTRSGTDTGGNLSIVSSTLNVGQTDIGWGDPGIVYTPAFSRTNGLAVFFINYRQSAVPGSSGGIIGWSNNATPGLSTFPSGGIRPGSGANLYVYDGTTLVTTGVTYAINNDNNYIVVLRPAGAYVLAKGESYSSDYYENVWVSDGGADVSIYAGFANRNNAYTVDEINVGQLTASAWKNDAVYADLITSAVANDSINGFYDNYIVSTWTPTAASTFTIYFRYRDANNHWHLDCDQAAGTIKLYSKRNGVDTENLAGKTQTWNVGTPYKITIKQKYGSTYTFVNGVNKHNYTGVVNRVVTGSKMVMVSAACANFAVYPMFIDNNLRGIGQNIFNIERAYAINATGSFATPTYDGSNESTHPSVYDSGGTWNGYRYWMAMTPLPAGAATFENPSILVSDDGDTWIVPVGLTNPIDPSPGGAFYNSDPNLLMDNDTLYCYYRESDGVIEDRIKLKSSTDGINWSAESALFTVAASECISPAVIYFGGQYFMFSNANSGPTIQRRTASSPSGPWSAPANCNISGGTGFATLWHIEVIAVGSRFYMLYNNNSRDFYFAYSDDAGLNWISAASRAMAAGSGGWDNFLYKGSLIYRSDGNFDLWYGAYEGAAPTIWHIGRTILGMY